MKHYFSFLAVVLLLLIFSVGVFAQEDVTIAAALEASADDESEFTILFQLLDETDLLETLDDSEAEFTVFAPTDEAFEALLDELEMDIDELLAEPDVAASILLYHLVEGTLLSEDLEDDMELETLNGASIVVTVTSSGDVILDEFATIVEPDLEVSNGVIHLIDGVLLPPDEESSDAGSGESCFIFTEEADTIQIRVGPGENRGVVAFLPVDVEFEVLGQATDSDDNVWFKLDKEEATPNRSNAEAWVAADDVETIGNCDDVIDVNAPPVIPITQQQPTAVPSNSGGGTDTGTSPTPAPSRLPNGGSWTISWNATTNASCTGTGNVAIPTVEILGSSGMSSRTSVSNTGASSFNFFGVSMSHIGNNVYQGSVSFSGLTGTIYIDTVTGNQMTGRFITSFDTCSATITFVANHN
jgi:uncharacterized surface protein with fasciclin (FAS1) repeats